MNNSYLVGTGKCLGSCSILPSVGEEHRFGDTEVKFSYNVGDLLFFSPIKNEVQKWHEFDKQMQDKFMDNFHLGESSITIADYMQAQLDLGIIEISTNEDVVK